tara:strand:+ start:544 stop:978 length:435 start_codon:yes stop_codon:yes gene_type:complete
MIKNLFKKKESVKNIDIHESDVALRLMFEIAISDGKLDSTELALIKKRASNVIDENVKVSTIVRKIIDESENSVSLYPTVQKVNASFNKDEKIDLLKILWELVTIDKIIDPYEENLFYKISDLIKIPRAKANQIKFKNSQGLST